MVNRCVDALCETLMIDSLKSSQKDQVMVIGLDGPTAAGKTIFADNFAKFCSKKLGRSVFVYRLDWTLKSRKDRLKDLKVIEEIASPFTLEAELHMDLSKLKSFLETVSNFNKSYRHLNTKNPMLEIELENLYSRKNDGQLSGSAKFNLTPSSIVIVEGHYSLRSELNKYFDLNILILSNQNTLLKRKIDRVSGYRSKDSAEHYFNLIDVPSFDKHLERFGHNATHIIQNDDYTNPALVESTVLYDWREQTKKVAGLNKDEKNQPLTVFDITKIIFESSKLAPKNIKSCIEIIFLNIFDIDYFIGNTVVNSVDDQKSGLEAALNVFVSNSSLQLQKIFPACELELKFSNALHNVYFRMFPISFGVGIKGMNDFGIIFDVFEDRLEGCTIWQGGILPFKCPRKLGGISVNESLSWQKQPFIENPNQKNSTDFITLLSPSDFMTPPFLKDIKINVHKKSGKEHQRLSPTKSFAHLSNGKFCWVVRFPLQSEVLFFSKLCELAGADAVCIGNYLLALKTNQLKTQKEFKAFQKSWSRDNKDTKECNEDIKAYDLEVLQQRYSLSKEVSSSIIAFKELDTHLFIQDKNCNTDTIVKSLYQALRSKNRLLRKRAYQFIIRSYGDLKLNVDHIWPDFTGTGKSISFSNLCDFQPSIMGEIYLWQTIAGYQSAILGANVYDISQSSLDASGHLMAARKEGVPVILQASLNALGKSFNGGKAGYLNSSHGSKDLVNAVLHAAKALFLDRGISPPLFGIGLDHVDSRNDNPAGRAKDFLTDALETGLITHIVLDGSSLFNAQGSSKEDFKNAYKSVAQYSSYLLQDIGSVLLVDKEICGGELNYIGDSVLANIPEPEEIRVFVDALKKSFRPGNLRSSLCRPMLFIGNVGTTHHAGDSSEVKPEITKEWVEEVKSDLFISAVLHGTTGSQTNILKSALSGCKKVNVAGDFLHTYLEALPDDIQRTIREINQEEPKKALADVRELILAMSSEQREYVTDSIFEHSRKIMQTISSPKLAEADVNYFRYVPFIFSDEELDEIMRQVRFSIDFDPGSAHLESFEEVNKPEFCPSMIEVQYGSQFDSFASQFLDKGIMNFHIDVGDGKFISREFSGLEKLKKLKRLDSKLKSNIHMMVRDPHLANEDGDQLTFVQTYALAGCSRIGVHRNSFSSMAQMKDCFIEIRKCGVEPGIVIEVDEPLSDMFCELVIEQKLPWVVIMGVPIGYGGQIFNISAIEKIFQLRHFSFKNKLNLDIEIDGGLTLDNIRACRKAGANLFSGWSIVKPEPNISMLEKLVLLEAQLLRS